MNPTVNSKVKWILGSIIGIIAISIFYSSSFLKNTISREILEQATASNAESIAQAEPAAPEYSYFRKDPTVEPKVSSKAYLVGDLNTGETILAKNQDQKFPIASTSKLMTAFVATELPSQSDIAQVSKKALATYGGNGNFHIGQKIRIADLLYPLLLESSNDASEIIAEHFGRETFIQKMNQEAEKLTMTSTSYEDPSGLSPNNQSTPTDLFKFAAYLDQTKPEILQITTQKSYSTKKYHWFSTNQFLGDDGYQGGKSGYTDPARETVVSLFSLPLAESSARPVGIVLLQSKDRHKDVENILKYLKNNVYYGGATDANTTWVKQKEGIPEIKDPDFITFAFGGDIMLDRGVKNSVLKNFNGDYSALFEKLSLFKKSDIVFANLEGTASDQGQNMHNLYSFRMDPAVVPALAGAGISILSVANNHVGDWGLPAYIDTLSRLKENEILYTGGGNNKGEAETPAIIEKYGMKIGFLGFSDKGPNWMAAKDDRAGILSASDPRFDEIIQNASKQVDYLVVSFHFGEEYQAKHNARQEELAHRAVDDGAKIIIGSHPHVVEDTEVYKNSYIAYSLGNFIFDQKFSEATMQGMLLQLKLNRDGSMSVKKNTVKLNSAFQPDKIIEGKEEKVKFQEVKS